MSESTAERVARAVWPWREARTDRAAARARAVRRRSLVQGAVALAASAFLAGVLKHRAMGGVVLGLATVLVLSGRFWPRVFEAIDRGVGRLVRGVGALLTWLTLVPFFFLCFVPGRLLLALTGKDLLRRKFPGSEKSYWDAYRLPEDTGQYKKQY